MIVTFSWESVLTAVIPLLHLIIFLTPTSPTCSRMDNKEISVDGNQEDREGGQEDTGGLGDPHQLAQNLLQNCLGFLAALIA